MASPLIEATAEARSLSPSWWSVIPPLLRTALQDTTPAVAVSDVRPHLPALLSWCEGQQLIPLVGEGLLHLLDFADTPDARSLMARMGAFAAHSAWQTETALRICTALEEAAVMHMPLKGIWLKPLYPYPEWRVMGDVDILVSPADKARATAVLSSLGCVAGIESDHECHFRTREGVHIELHKSLVPTYECDLYAYFADGFSRSLPLEGWRYRMVLSPEDTYIYLLAHMAKHYRTGGVGVRYAVDLYLFRRAYAMDESALARAFATLGLTMFEACARRLTLAWFDGQAHDAQTARMEQFLFSGGVYGDGERAEISLGARLARKGSQARRARFRRLLFPSYETMCLGGHTGGRWKLPLWWIGRWWELLGTRRSHCREKLERLSLIDDDSVAALSEELAAVGLTPPSSRRTGARGRRSGKFFTDRRT